MHDSFWCFMIFVIICANSWTLDFCPWVNGALLILDLAHFEPQRGALVQQLALQGEHFESVKWQLTKHLSRYQQQMGVLTIAGPFNIRRMQSFKYPWFNLRRPPSFCKDCGCGACDWLGFHLPPRQTTLDSAGRDIQGGDPENWNRLLAFASEKSTSVTQHMFADLAAPGWIRVDSAKSSKRNGATKRWNTQVIHCTWSLCWDRYGS